LAAYPDDLQALKGRAFAQTQLNDFPAALQSYRQVLEKYPDDRTSKMELARLSGRQGQYGVSIKCYQEVLKGSPEDSEALEGLARAYVWSKRDGEALPIYQGLLARNPANNAYRLEVARIYGKLFGPVDYDLNGGLGVQQTQQGTDLKRGLRISPAVTFRVNRHFSFTVGYTHYNASQALGTLRGNSVRFSTDWKF
jgi:tetratricopeptide (TPR) repeat protein